ncbi:Uma2 family endonuclease [Ancylobacter amanitiformis]|uniref:Uma2 family endonuclease n=1 Tax=Ancylobacter amanitiformis TaxID=217069 RepID=A0ABU0LL53_9HYPH|nr:Uma2 family endonuclease [Ancylobacter amanitiformis]MDQ0509434.1 Uma2 family endonuclease [Ancylobacter amanitiformis]
MAPHALKRMTPEEFYRWPGEDGVRYELVDGFPLKAMTGASQRHDTITLNVLAALRQKLRGSPCRANTAGIAVATMTGNIRRPDALVDCGVRLDTAYEASSPRLVVEVLSPSTRQTDLVRKLEEYKALPSLAYILLVEPDVPSVLLWWRAPGDGWELAAFDGLEGVVGLPGIRAELAMAEIYEDMRFPDPLAGEGGLR